MFQGFCLAAQVKSRSRHDGGPRLGECQDGRNLAPKQLCSLKVLRFRFVYNLKRMVGADVSVFSTQLQPDGVVIIFEESHCGANFVSTKIVVCTDNSVMNRMVSGLGYPW